MQSAIWLSFDLGVRGDYEGIYAWLDSNGAIECGDSMAHLKYEHSGDLITDLKADLKNSVGITKKTRIYIIYRDTEKDTWKGKFIIGTRKAAPWSGFGSSGEQDEEGEV